MDENSQAQEQVIGVASDPLVDQRGFVPSDQRKLMDATLKYVVEGKPEQRAAMS